MENTAEKILEQLKKNEVQLANIAANQETLLQIEQSRLSTQRLQMFTGWAKIFLIVIITWISFVAAQKLVTEITKNMGGLLGASSQINQANNFSTQLNGSQELIREWLGS